MFFSRDFKPCNSDPVVIRSLDFLNFKFCYHYKVSWALVSLTLEFIALGTLEFLILALDLRIVSFPSLDILILVHLPVKLVTLGLDDI